MIVGRRNDCPDHAADGFVWMVLEGSPTSTTKISKLGLPDAEFWMLCTGPANRPRPRMMPVPSDGELAVERPPSIHPRYNVPVDVSGVAGVRVTCESMPGQSSSCIPGRRACTRQWNSAGIPPPIEAASAHLRDHCFGGDYLLGLRRRLRVALALFKVTLGNSLTLTLLLPLG